MSSVKRVLSYERPSFIQVFPSNGLEPPFLDTFPHLLSPSSCRQGTDPPPQKRPFSNCEERQLMRYAPFPSCNTTLTTFFAREFRLLTSTVGTSLFMQSSMLSFLSKPGNGAEENHEGRSITIHYISSPFSLSGIERLPRKNKIACVFFQNSLQVHTVCRVCKVIILILHCPYISILSFHVKHTPRTNIFGEPLLLNLLILLDPPPYPPPKIER